MSPSDRQQPSLVELIAVRKSYPDSGGTVEALAGIDLTLGAGEAVVIRGVSGSGKTTLLNLLGGIDQATSGAVRVCGADLGALDRSGLTLFRRQKVGFVFQFHNLLPTLTARENVALALEAVGFPRADLIPRALHYLASVGLAAKADAFPQQMSGGEQQRVAIARALAKEPPLLLADEPTGNLDEAASAAVLDLLNALRERLGTTLILASHDPATVRLACPTLVLQGGRLSAPADRS